MRGVLIGVGVVLLLAAGVALRASLITDGGSAGEAGYAPSTRNRSVPAETQSRSYTDYASRPMAAPISHEPPSPPTGPAAGVWKVLQTSHASVTEERDALVEAFRAAPPCVEQWCEQGRRTLAAWQMALAAKIPGALSAETVECSSAGCFVKLVVSDPTKWRDVAAALPSITMENNWPGPTIQGGPDFSTRKGSVISLWAILPGESQETASLEEGNK